MGAFRLSRRIQPAGELGLVTYLAIDQSTIVPMIENYRTQLCWDMFMANPEIAAMLKKIGWSIDVVFNDA